MDGSGKASCHLGWYRSRKEVVAESYISSDADRARWYNISSLG